MKTSEIFINSAFKENSVWKQILGICSALAVTNLMLNSLIMGLGVIFSLALSNFTISMIRNYTPRSVRMMVQTLIIAAYVIIVDIFLKAYMPDISKQLGPYVGLIITNCILMGRLEAFAMSNKPWQSFLDGLGNGAGYGLILITVGFFRELLGSGSLLGIRIIPESWYLANGGFYSNNGMMILPPMALITIGTIIWIQRSKNRKLIEK